MVKTKEARQTVDESRELLADQMAAEGRFGEARKLYKKIWQSSDKTAIVSGRIFRKIGNAYNQQWRFKDAEAAYETAEQYLLTAADSSEKWSEWIDLQIDFCYVLMHLRKLSSFENKKDNLKAQTDVYGDVLQKARYSHIIFTDMLWKYRWYMLPDETVVTCKGFIKLAEAEGNMEAKLSLQNMLAYTYLFRQEFVKARELALEILDNVDERTFGEEVVRAYCTICFSYRWEQNIEQTKVWLQKAYHAAASNKNQTFKHLMYSISGWLYLVEGDLQNAEKYCVDSYDGVVQHSYPFLAYSILPLIAIYVQQNKIHKAVQFAFRLLAPNQLRVSDVINNNLKKSIMCWGKNDIEGARKSLERVIRDVEIRGFL